MIISISGTPGTGKTSVAALMAKQLGAKLISLKALRVPYEYDKPRKTRIVDIKDMQRAVNRKLSKNKINVIEGHLSHLLKADIFIILRTNPIALEKRLKIRKWSGKKIKENAMAEFLDEIVIEAIERHGRKNVFEIDTSKKKGHAATKIAEEIIRKRPAGYKAGKIDWSKNKNIVKRMILLTI